MTTTTARAREEPTDQRLAHLDAMLTRAGLHLQVPRDDAVQALVLTFAKHRPGSKTAGLVGQAMTSHRGPEQERPADQQAARRLIARGEPAYRRAIEAEVERAEAAAAAQPARQARTVERLGPIAERDGQSAAAVVITSWRERGCAPTPCQVARELGWRTRDAYPLCRLLIDAGWLDLHRGRLRPGPRARTATR